MRNMQTRKTQTGPDDAGLVSMLAEARLDERRSRADVMASRLDNLANHIANGKLTSVEAAELLRDEAVKIVNEAQDLH
ncbi:DUF2732 domain-containing protein [Cronobacter malonaticus]|nr:DUF2732 domain-containing protein [Cronobacter malonaticus]ELY4584906.1 DUF2732 domain-containing protein [Cronobacter malonaticus]